MTDDEGGSAREIFLVALARMSDQCESPDLIAACPFSVDLPTGGRGCGEECESILSEEAPDRRPGEMTLGNHGVSARPRPSLPKPPVPVGRAFDATEIYYRDSETQLTASWSPVALLVGLKRVATTHPYERTPEQHLEALDCLDELRRKGFNVEALCHGPMAVLVATSIISDVVARTVSHEPDAATDTGNDSVDSRLDLRDAMFAARTSDSHNDKASLLVDGQELDTPEAAKVVFTVAGDFGVAVARWARGASPEDLLAWNVDADDERPTADEPDRRRTAQWLFDRFTNTYLSEWAPESLREEWRSRQNLESPVADDLMAARRIDPLELATELADLAVDDRAQQIRNGRLVTSAVRLIKAGRRDAAAAMFDGVRRSDSEDPELHNNYGFCLLPDDPEKALPPLERAFRAGRRDAVNRANRALCLSRIGRYRAALDVLDDAFEVWEDLDTSPAYLWSFDSDGEPKLTSECPRCYLVRLGEHVATLSADDSAIALWSRRTSRLVHQADSR